MPNQIIPVQWGKPLRKSEVNTIDKVNELVDFINNSDIHELDLIASDQGREVVTGTSTQLAQLEVYGESVQDGTPTPDNPVPVEVVSGTVNLQIGETVTPIDLQGHTLASLPDGTRDVLRVDSTGRVWIEKNTYLTTLGTFTFNISSPEQHIFRSRQFGNNPAPYAPYGGATTIGLSSGYEPIGYAPLSASDNGKFAIGGAYIGEVLVVIDFRYSTLEEFAAATANTQLLYKLYEPQTIELGTINPPAIPSGSVVEIIATLQPEFTLAWFTENGLPLAVNDMRDYVDAKINEVNARIDELHGITRANLEVQSIPVDDSENENDTEVTENER